MVYLVTMAFLEIGVQRIDAAEGASLRIEEERTHLHPPFELLNNAVARTYVGNLKAKSSAEAPKLEKSRSPVCRMLDNILPPFQSRICEM